MTESIALLTIFVLAAFVGVEVISKVSSTLHTPLMSGANAIHGVILVGAIIVTGQAESTIVVIVGAPSRWPRVTAAVTSRDSGVAPALPISLDSAIA